MPKTCPAPSGAYCSRSNFTQRRQKPAIASTPYNDKINREDILVHGWAPAARSGRALFRGSLSPIRGLRDSQLQKIRGAAGRRPTRRARVPGRAKLRSVMRTKAPAQIGVNHIRPRPARSTASHMPSAACGRSDSIGRISSAEVEQVSQPHRQSSWRADLRAALPPRGQISLERDSGPFGPSIYCPEIFDASWIALKQRQDAEDGRPRRNTPD
jgi:hypothetical protein